MTPIHPTRAPGKWDILLENVFEESNIYFTGKPGETDKAAGSPALERGKTGPMLAGSREHSAAH